MIIRRGSSTQLMKVRIKACFGHYPLMLEACARLAWRIEQSGDDYSPRNLAELIAQCINEAETRVAMPLPPPNRIEFVLFADRAIAGFLTGDNHTWFVEQTVRWLDEFIPARL